jgi:geranylgeranyl diphosphate synthase type I
MIYAAQGRHTPTSSARRALVAQRMREVLSPYHGGVYDLVAYHLGWADVDGRPAEMASGKLVRPLLCLAAAHGYGDERAALDAAVALELLHAFSLVHDDIEDGDTERRHRPTLWALRGVPMAINAGDSLFALAHRVLIDAVAALPPTTALRALRLFEDATLRMIEGQHDDLEFETRSAVTLAEYVRMTSGKTGALIGASLALGGVFGGGPEDDVNRLQEAGVSIGIAFQAVDDALSFWGDARRTGKAVGNDAARGKKSLPVVLGAALNGHGERETALRTATQALAREHAERGRSLLRETTMRPEGRSEIEELIDFILEREG